MEILRSEGDFVESAAQQWLREKRGAFADLPVAVQRRCILLQLRALGIAGDFDLVEDLRTTDHPVTIPGGLTLSRTKNGLDVANLSQLEPFAFSSKRTEVNLARAGGLKWGGVRFRWSLEPLAPGKVQIPAKQPCSEHFDAQKVGRKAILRHWHPGDRFQPIGMTAAVKLQDLWVNLKVPREERARRIVATTGQGEVFWVEGLRIGERFKLDKTTRQQLKWFWDRL